jgi:hypothetical protein
MAIFASNERNGFITWREQVPYILSLFAMPKKARKFLIPKRSMPG